MLGRRIEGERVDRHVAVSKPDFQIASFQERGELPVAVPQIKNDGERVVLLRVRDAEIHEETLAASRRTQHDGMADVLDVQVEGVGRVMRSLKDRQRVAPEMSAPCLSSIEREQEAQIGHSCAHRKQFELGADRVRHEFFLE